MRDYPRESGRFLRKIKDEKRKYRSHINKFQIIPDIPFLHEDIPGGKKYNR
jgi:hypothetical protein